MRRMFGFIIGIFVGSLVGSMIALLLAPETGEKLRSQIRERGQGFVNNIRHAADSRRIELRDRLDSLRAPRQQL
jgi:gas vesicle protein